MGYESLDDDTVAKHTGWTLAEVQEIITSGIRKRIVANNITDPFRGLAKVKENLALLTDVAIAKRLEWTTKKVAEVITPSLRKIMAVNYMANPFAVLDRLKDSLELLTTERIAEHLQKSHLYVELTFTLHDILYVAVNYKDPLDALKRVIGNIELLSDKSVSQYLNIPIGKAKAISYPEGKLTFAMSNMADPLGALRRRVTKRKLDKY